MGTMQSVLAEGAVYSGDNGRLLCAATRCAGVTASASGRDLSGHKVTRVSTADLESWPTADLGPFGCECGRVTLSPLAGSDGWPIPTMRASVTA